MFSYFCFNIYEAFIIISRIFTDKYYVIYRYSPEINFFGHTE